MLPVLVPLLRRDGELDLTDEEAVLLVAMSAATIDRRLAGAKVLAGFRGTSHTKPGSLLKTQIPIRTWSEWDDVTPGFVEIDRLCTQLERLALSKTGPAPRAVNRAFTY
jgi:hypothetical protein